MRAVTKHILVEGLIAGVIGYATVVLVFLLVNVLIGRSPFYTAALLGSVLFYGVRDPAQVAVWTGPVLAYNGAHLLVFLLIGVAAAWLATESERGPQFWYLGLSLFLIMVFHMYGAAIWFAEPILDTAVHVSILLAGLLSAAAMFGYLWRAHPRLRRAFREYEDQPI